jgi:RecB family exonuclease
MDDAPAAELVAYLRAPGLLERPEIADRLELEVSRTAVASAERARELVSVRLGEIDSLRTAGDPGAELARQARRLFAAPFRGRAPQLAADEELDARALGGLLRALDELDELGERGSTAELIDLLEELEVGAGELERPGSVLIADPLAVRARRFRAVFVCGLQEGGFPLPGAPEPFLSDERRRELAAASGLFLRAREDAVARERYLFYACVSRATEQVVLSYRSSDEEGNIELPSPFVADVADLLVEGWAKRRGRRLLADVVWPPELAPTAREFDRSLVACGAPTAGEPAPPERVLHEAALGHVRHREVVSAGALETFASCPVRWLVQRELAPAEFEPDPEALTRGSYVHDVLEQLLRRLAGPVTPASLPRANALLDELLNEVPFPLAPGRPEPVRAGIRAAVEADLRRYLAHEAADGCGWVPQGLELRFGFAEDDEERPSLPALKLSHGDDAVAMRGLIDRVDVEPGDSRRAVVRDYKSGSARNEHQGARWAPDDQLQVALYMLAVRELLGLAPVAGLYQPLGGNDLRARGVFLEGVPVGESVVDRDSRSPEELEEVLSVARERAVALAAKLRSGELGPSPQSCSRDGCRYPGICRSQ